MTSPYNRPTWRSAKVNQLTLSEMKTLSDPNASQDDKIKALASLRDKKKTIKENVRQRPASAYANNQQGVNFNVPPRRSIQDEMLDKKTTAYGHQVSPGSYQEFSTHEVMAAPKVNQNVGGNETNFGFADPLKTPSSVIAARMNTQEQANIGAVVSGLKRMSAQGNLPTRTVFERWERQSDIDQEHLYLVGLAVNVLSERYDSTAGEWVVTMPWSDPQTAEQVLYNQKGVSNVDYKTLEKRQKGNYGVTPEVAYRNATNPSLPPAKPEGAGASQVPYYSNAQQETAGLMNPRRGDDYIRATRVQQAIEAAPKRVKKDKDPVTMMANEMTRYQQGGQVKTKTNVRRGANKVIAAMKEEVALYTNALDEAMREYNQAPGYKKDRAKKKVQGLKNMLVSKRATLKKAMQDVGNQDIPKDNVESYAESFNTWQSGADYLRRQENYDRHLDLLSQAKDLLSKPHHQGGFLG